MGRSRWSVTALHRPHGQGRAVIVTHGRLAWGGREIRRKGRPDKALGRRVIRVRRHGCTVALPEVWREWREGHRWRPERCCLDQRCFPRPRISLLRLTLAIVPVVHCANCRLILQMMSDSEQSRAKSKVAGEVANGELHPHSKAKRRPPPSLNQVVDCR
jgi:hypothetical protein